MTQSVFSAILAIRDSGVCNMCDYRAVQRVAFEKEFYNLVLYIEDDPKRFFHFILSGELPDGEVNPATASSSPVEKLDVVEKAEVMDAGEKENGRK